MALLRSVALAAGIFTVAAPAFAQDYQWFYNRYIDGEDVFQHYVGVSFGVPETDDQPFTAACVIGAGGTYVAVEAGIDIGPLAADDPALITIQTDQGYFGSFNAQIINNEMLSGVGFSVENGDPFFAAMAGHRTMTLSIVGANQTQTYPLTGSAMPWRNLAAECPNLGDLGSVPPYGATGAGPTPQPQPLPVPQVSEGLTCDQAAAIPTPTNGAPQPVTFQNGSDGYRTVMWIDYEGIPQHFGALNPGEVLVIDSFVGHVWMMTDGPGNCLEAMQVRQGQDFYVITAPNRFFGNE